VSSLKGCVLTNYTIHHPCARVPHKLRNRE
jgi:hypothetical protein